MQAGTGPMAGEPREGDLLGGRYRIVRRIGAGGMGTVYEARQEDLGRAVALKMLLPSAAQQPDALERFTREARTAASLGHPNIVQITDLHVRPGEPAFIVMELVTGPSLRDVVDREGPLDPARACHVVSQVLSALGAAHRSGIIHRDVKPGNVLLVSTTASRDIAKVVDFGIAKLMDETQAPLTRAGAVMGTLAYMAPEQAMGRPIDARADLYAAGVTLFYALTGRRPIEGGGNATDLLARLQLDPPARVDRVRPGIDRRLGDVVDRALAKEPSQRFANAEQMIDALRPFMAPSLAPPNPALAPTNAALASITRTAPSAVMAPATMTTPHGVPTAPTAPTVAAVPHVIDRTLPSPPARHGAARSLDSTLPSRQSQPPAFASYRPPMPVPFAPPRRPRPTTSPYLIIAGTLGAIIVALLVFQGLIIYIGAHVPHPPPPTAATDGATAPTTPATATATATASTAATATAAPSAGAGGGVKAAASARPLKVSIDVVGTEGGPDTRGNADKMVASAVSSVGACLSKKGDVVLSRCPTRHCAWFYGAKVDTSSTITITKSDDRSSPRDAFVDACVRVPFEGKHEGAFTAKPATFDFEVFAE